MVCTPNSAAVRPIALASAEIGISARQDSSRSAVVERPRSITGAVMSSTSQPTIATGTATGTKENIDNATPDGAASAAINRLELVPIRVAEPASVVTCAIGSRTPRAGTPDCCSSSFAAGMSIATIGVVLIRAETNPTGGISLRSA